MAYTHPQEAIIRELRATARRRYSDPHERSVKLKAALETGLVESNFTNLSGGDADSAGWRQERGSLYHDPTNVGHSINRFFDEADQHWDGKMDAGTLAAKVQRPAAQYANRYGLAGGKVQGLLKGSTSDGSTSSSGGTASKLTPGGTKVDDDAALTDALLDHKRAGSLLKRYQARVDSGNYTTETASKVTPGTPGKTYLPDGATTAVSSHAKAGSPVAGGTSEGGLHDTMGLAGYPAHDYFAKAGSHAVAPVSGTVVRLSGHDPKNGPTNGPHGPLGYSVYIKGDDGKEYFLTHMGSRTVKAGQKLKQGQIIGTVADYDKYGTPSHIHMGVSG